MRPKWFVFVLTSLVCVITTTQGQVPSVVSMDPISGPVGTTVSITGTNSSLNPSGNNVSFGAVYGDVLSATASKLRFVLPGGVAMVR